MSSIQETDQASAARAVAPRVSLASMEAKIKTKHFVNAGEATNAKVASPLHLMTLCILEMENGFIVVGKTAPASPANFSLELGEKFSYEDAIRQLWPLEGYALREKLTANVV